MLRLALLVLYLIASSSVSSSKQSGSADSLGLTDSPPFAPTADAGAGYDPDGAK